MRRLALCIGLLLSPIAILGPLTSFAVAASKATPPATAADLQLFTTEEAAQKHCPKDQVVWLNLPSGIYHEKGMRWYGHTKHGAYVCRKEADAAGDRDTRNGQSCERHAPACFRSAFRISSR
jgi:hypothetical protein